jgi:hypothetical protein
MIKIENNVDVIKVSLMIMVSIVCHVTLHSIGIQVVNNASNAKMDLFIISVVKYVRNVHKVHQFREMDNV